MEATQLPLYQCHKKVRAAKIIGFTTEGAENVAPHPSIFVESGVEGYYRTIPVDAAWLTRNPALAVGGYFVEYQEGDKYTAYSPAAPFESGYTLIGSEPAPSRLTLEKEIERTINSYSVETGSDTPDFILAQYVIGCLDVFNSTVNRREAWYGRLPESPDTGCNCGDCPKA